MGEVLMQPMGGGIGSDDVTAAKAHVLAGPVMVTLAYTRFFCLRAVYGVGGFLIF